MNDAADTTDVFGLYELEVTDVCAHCFHRSASGDALIDDGLDEISPRFPVGIPVTVKRGESSRSERLIDRSYELQEWKARCDGVCVIGEFFRKARIEQTGVTWTASMMNQPDNRSDFSFR